MDQDSPFEVDGRQISIRLSVTEAQLTHLLHLAEGDKRPKLGLADHLRRNLQALQAETYHRDRERRIERMSREKEAKEKTPGHLGDAGGAGDAGAQPGRSQ